MPYCSPLRVSVRAGFALSKTSLGANSHEAANGGGLDTFLGQIVEYFLMDQELAFLPLLQHRE